LKGVRRATIADVDQVAPLFDAYREFYGVQSDIAAARRFLSDRLERDESVVFLAIEGRESDDVIHDSGAVLGFAQLYSSFSSVSAAAIVILNDLFVAPNARGRGVAGSLIDAAVDYAHRKGAIRLDLSTQRSNHAATRLYRAKGFVTDTEFVHMSLATHAARSL
jgi:ribosomal protein S18 acetylase RimI-like enzyme